MRIPIPVTYKFFFKLADFWVGAYIDTTKQIIYICPIPMCGIKVEYGWAIL